MNEFELIEHLSRQLPTNPTTIVGAGDDCAVLDLGVPGRHFLFKTDAAVEGVHFACDADPRRIGHKALARCFSDVAAMAGTPTHALVTLGLPSSWQLPRVELIYEGLTALARRYDVAVVGGETTASPDRTFLSVALLGWVDPAHCPLRSGARPGDAVFVTGELGGSLGSGRHLDFEPRLAEAHWIAEHFAVSAMIDLSDGLAGDLRHVLKASGVGAELLASAIPVSGAAREQARLGHKTPLEAALSDGEDFELLFTVPSRVAVQLQDDWKTQFPKLRLSCVGKIRAEPGVRLHDAGGPRPLETNGYVHFSKP